MTLTSPGSRFLRVRVASPSDALLLAEMAARTFVESFGVDNRAEDMKLHLGRTYGEAIQRRELTDPALTYLIADAEGTAAGYALVREGKAPACVTDERPIEIQRFYMEQPWHGRDVGWQEFVVGTDAQTDRVLSRAIPL